MPKSDGPAYPIESVDRALSLILAFDGSDGITVTEAGKFLGVSRSTAFRLLNVLEHREFVRQDKRSKVFHPGPALLRVGLAAVQQSDIRATLRPLLEQVVAEVDETAHLVVLQRDEAFYLDCVEGSKFIRAATRVGTALPAFLSAGGMALLANLPPARVDEVLATTDFRASLPGTKASATSVRRDLARVVKTNRAVISGGPEAGLRAVAVVVPAARMGVAVDSAITVAGPANRLDPERIDAIAEAMLRITAAAQS